MSEITISSLHIYPVKSARGIAAARARVTDRGFADDRRFMVVDAAGRFLSQRELPRMALIAVAVDHDRLTVAAPGMEALDLPLHPKSGAPRTVAVWDDRCPAIAVGEAAARWVSEFLGRRCELVYMPDDSLRPTDAAYGPVPGRVSFADGYPFLLASTASLDQLRERGADVPMDRFRPNLVVTGCAPFAEDSWATARVGGVLFHVVKPCGRCPITTVDQATAAVGKEPLRTLAGFRRSGKDVIFAQNLTHVGEGTISVGDRVEVTAKR